jgi:uncharacterized membrane protein HdeD (DUF308 family)
MGESGLDRRLDATDWRWPAWVGAMLFAGGLVGAVLAGPRPEAALAMVGLACLAAGAGHFGMSFTVRTERGARWTGRALGAMLVVLGAALLFDPFAWIAPQRASVGVVLIVVGVLRVAAGWRITVRDGRHWRLASGLVSLAAGLAVTVVIDAAAIGAFAGLLAVDLLAAGVAGMAVALRARRL